MSEYTKGFWKVAKNGLDFVIMGGVSGKVEIADVIPGVSDEAYEANAHVIAAAPDLYKALMALRSFMWKEGYADQTLEMAQADAAIKKAEGR